jgi:ribose-phosphate pyrophosphokinase
VNLLGDVRGKTAILIDDMIDTGHTICAAIKKIKQEGAEKVYTYSTHPVFSKPAPGNIFKLGISEMVVADTIPITRNYKKLQVLSVAPLLSSAIENIHQNKSVSALFN